MRSAQAWAPSMSVAGRFQQGSPRPGNLSKLVQPDPSGGDVDGGVEIIDDGSESADDPLTDKEGAVTRKDDTPGPGRTFVLTINRGPDCQKLGLHMYTDLPSLAGVIVDVSDSTMAGTLVKKYDRLLSMNGIPLAAPEISKVLADDRVVELKIRRPSMYTLVIRREAEGLGLVLGYADNEALMIIEDIQDGTVKKLNAKYQDREVRTYDCILRVNGIADDVQAMVRAMEEKPVLKLKLARWYHKAELMQELSTRRDFSSRRDRNQSAHSTSYLDAAASGTRGGSASASYFDASTSGAHGAAEDRNTSSQTQSFADVGTDGATGPGLADEQSGHVRFKAFRINDKEEEQVEERESI